MRLLIFSKECAESILLAYFDFRFYAASSKSEEEDGKRQYLS